MRSIKYIGVLLGVVLLSACDPIGADTNPGNPVDVSITTDVTVHEGEEVRNIDPPTKLHVIMDPSGDPEQRCLDMGGGFMSANGLLLCQDVDY